MFEDGEMEETENNEEITSLSGDEDLVLRDELKLLLEVKQVLILVLHLNNMKIFTFPQVYPWLLKI